MQAWEPATWRLVWDVLQTLITAAIGIYVWQANRHRVTRDSVETLRADSDQRLDNLGHRVTTLESDMRHLPTHNEMGKVYDRINSVHGQLQELIGSVRGLDKSIRMINEHLLETGRDGLRREND